MLKIFHILAKVCILVRAVIVLAISLMFNKELKMRINKFFYALGMLVLAFALGCSSQTGGSFSSGQSRVSHTVSFGTIVHLADAMIENSPSGGGAIAGGVAGGVVGSTIGGGRGRTLAVVGGALAGAAAGNAVEGSMRRSQALEITVRLENGQSIAVVQELGAEERSFRVGDHVRVLRGSDGSTRVRR